MRRIEKPWGRMHLGLGFVDVPADCAPVGEIRFGDVGDEDDALLVKYLFTGGKLSVQVHPDDEAARAHGFPSGKDEAWYVVAAEPYAAIGMGLRDVMDRNALTEAVCDGSIEDRLCWRAVKPGDFFYSPAGTVHAIGAGLTLVEVQQNVDLTYRLYDYERPRELHVVEGIAASDPVPYVTSFVPVDVAPGRRLLANGPAFVLEQWRGERRVHVDGSVRPLWIVPVHGAIRIDGQEATVGEVWRSDGRTLLDLGSSSELLLACPGEGALSVEPR